MNTFQINACYPPGIVSQYETSSICAASMQNLYIEATETAGKYVEVTKENEQLKAEIAQLKERLAALEK